MESALTIAQPITLVGCGLLFVMCPLLAGLLYPHLWKVTLPWIAAVILAAGFVFVGIELQEPGVGWVVNPFPLLLRYVYIYGSAALISFAVGIIVRRAFAHR